MEVKDLRRRFLSQPRKTSLYRMDEEQLIKIREDVRAIKLIAESKEETVEGNDLLFDLNSYLSVVRELIDQKAHKRWVKTQLERGADL